MTYEEIIKGLTELSLYTGFQEKHIQVLKASLDLITHQKSEIEVLYQINAKSEKEIYELRKRLLSRENLEESFNRSVRAFDKRLEKTVKLERAAAYKEFAEKLKNEIISNTAYGCDTSQHTGYYDYQIKIGDIPEYIDNLLKEMEKEDA